MDASSATSITSRSFDHPQDSTNEESPSLTAADGWELSKKITALRKGGNTEQAVTMARHGLEQLPDFEPLRSALSWALYQRDVKSLGEEPTIQELRNGWKTCRELKELLASELYGEFSAWTISVLRIASGMLNYGNGDTMNMITSARDMLLQLDNSLLSREGFQRTPSPAERHALGLTKAHHKLREWQPLRANCEQFIRTLAPQGDTELWLRHRLGIACLQLDDAQAAAPHLQFVLQRKPSEWWAMYNHGRALALTGNEPDAIKAFANALKGGNLKMKTGAMLELATLLRSQGRNDDANRHHLVARQIRQDQGWSSTPEIDAPISDNQTSTPQDLKKLKDLWEELTPEILNSGTIIKVLDSGGSGFVELEDGDRVYFSMKRDQPAPAEGTKITCRLVDSFDKKKNQASKKAIDVREAHS